MVDYWRSAACTGHGGTVSRLYGPGQQMEHEDTVDRMLMRERKRWQEGFTVCDCSQTKVSVLDGLKSGVLSVAPLTRTFAVLYEW